MEVEPVYADLLEGLVHPTPPPFPQVPTHSPVPQGRVGTLALSLGTGDGQKGHSMVVHVRCQSTHAAHWDDEHLPFNY